MKGADDQSQTDPDNRNTIPDSVRLIHFIAICGTGMGALACMLNDLGFDVVGSDQKIYPPMSDFLGSRGIHIYDGFDGRNLSPEPDLVVVGNAVSIANPEVVKMFEMELPYCSMPQAINRFIGAGKKPVLVAGTHGKTTTSSMVAWILHESGLDPSFFIGGILNNFKSNYRLGLGDYLVIEGDEYDTAFFDKGAKFLHYDPIVSVLTSVEFDHADIFSDLDHIKRVFDRFLSGLSEESTLFAFDGNETVTELIGSRKYPVRRYGRKGSSDWRLGEVSVQPPWTTFKVLKCNQIFGTFKTRMVGEHNLLNAVSAIGVGDSLGISAESIAGALESFQGVKRRQEIRGRKNGITVMDDFAHHPTAVRETLRAVRPHYPEGRLIAVFEPRTNSSMRDVFQTLYSLSFDAADIICIRKPPLLEKIPVGERFSSRKLVEDLRDTGKTAHYFPDTQSIIDFLVQSSRSDDLILIMSNGGFDNIHERLLSSL